MHFQIGPSRNECVLKRHTLIKCRTRIAHKGRLYARISFIYKQETSTFTPFVRPHNVLILAVRNIFNIQSSMESAFTYNPGLTIKRYASIEGRRLIRSKQEWFRAVIAVSSVRGLTLFWQLQYFFYRLIFEVLSFRNWWCFLHRLPSAQ